MEIQKDRNGITLYNPENFNARDILECGQVFRYKKCKDYYQVISLDKECKIFSYSDRIIIETENPDYFYLYFDLDNDYAAIIQTLNNRFNLTDATSFGRGIRILNQDPFETLISFIISAN
jgi:N-glycosylase/DNA lyase